MKDYKEKLKEEFLKRFGDTSVVVTQNTVLVDPIIAVWHFIEQLIDDGELMTKTDFVSESYVEGYNKAEKDMSTKLDELEAKTRRESVTGETSDGYHTFNELYEFRKLYNAAFFNELVHPYKLRHLRQHNPYRVHKSKKHSDGEECFGGDWFIVMATLPTGQISNHYELTDWNLFKCEERGLADVWDGHTAQDVAKRLKEYLSTQSNAEEDK